MPVYTFRCGICIADYDVVMSMDDCTKESKRIECPREGCEMSPPMTRIFKSIQVKRGFKEYFDRGLKRMVTSKGQIQEIEKREDKIYFGEDPHSIIQEQEKNRANIKKSMGKFKPETIKKLHEVLG